MLAPRFGAPCWASSSARLSTAPSVRGIEGGPPVQGSPLLHRSAESRGQHGGPGMEQWRALHCALSAGPCPSPKQGMDHSRALHPQQPAPAPQPPAVPGNANVPAPRKCAGTRTPQVCGQSWLTDVRAHRPGSHVLTDVTDVRASPPTHSNSTRVPCHGQQVRVPATTIMVAHAARAAKAWTDNFSPAVLASHDIQTRLCQESRCAASAVTRRSLN